MTVNITTSPPLGTHTSKVVAIHSVQPGNIRFETENTHYRLLLNPMSQAVDCRPALGVAA